MQPIIRVAGLGKRYRIAHAASDSRSPYRTLREDLVRLAAAPLKRLRGGDHRRREDFWALRDVDFEVQPGEVVGIIGRNGAGKSTLLKILSRITKPTTGLAELRGRVGSLLEVGTGFHPELTGRENIFLNGAILGMSRREIAAKFDEIVAFSEVERFLDTPVKRYSSGMYVRLAFAVAAHLEPEILIVDEVLAVGDAAFQRKCLGRMATVAQDGRTVLFVSHNLGAVVGLCQSACWLDQGRVRRLGEARAIVNEYVNATIAQATDRIDADAAPRCGDYGRRIRIRQVDVLTGLPARNLEPFAVRIQIAALSTEEEIALGMGFSTSEGTRVLSYDSDYNDLRFAVSQGETVTAEVRIDDLPLSPGLYCLDLGLRSGAHYGLDYLPSVVQFEVASGPRTPGFMGRHLNDVRLPGHWDWIVTERSRGLTEVTPS